MHTGGSLPSLANNTTGAYAVQGSAHKLNPGALQAPWLASTQAAPGVLSASAHSASVVHSLFIPPPEPQKLAPPVVCMQRQLPPPQPKSPVTQKSLAAVQRPTVCARHRPCLHRLEQHWPLFWQRFPT